MTHKYFPQIGENNKDYILRCRPIKANFTSLNLNRSNLETNDLTVRFEKLESQAGTSKIPIFAVRLQCSVW